MIFGVRNQISKHPILAFTFNSFESKETFAKIINYEWSGPEEYI